MSVVNLYFWIKGMAEAVPIEIGEPLGIDTRLVYAPGSESQEFLLFHEINENTGKWNKAILGKWNSSNLILETTKFTYPATIPLGQGWRNSLVTWELNSPVDQNICYERYKANGGANFVESSLYLIDFNQQLSGKPISEILFDTSFDAGTIKIKKYDSAIAESDCQLNNEQTIDSEVQNLRVIPPGELPENFEFELLALNYVG